MKYTPSRPYLQLVQRRNASTLLLIIGRKVSPGTVLHTDCWAAYNQARRQLDLQHFTINPRVNFVDRITGTHTQSEESNWNAAKEKFKWMKGNTNPNVLQEYLQEFTWRRWYTRIRNSGFRLDSHCILGRWAQKSEHQLCKIHHY